MPSSAVSAVDIVIFVFAVIFTLLSLSYIAMLWSIRRNFFIVLRSPRLACMFGLCISLQYVLKIYGLTVKWKSSLAETWGIITLLTFPLILTAEFALVMTAVRLLVMYYPAKRARWGRYTTETFLVNGLACLLVAMEIAFFAAAAAANCAQTIASVVAEMQTWSILGTILAAVALGGRLKRVRDFSNMSRDIRVLGVYLIVMLCLRAAVYTMPLPVLIRKYAVIVLYTISHPPVVWICIIRPVRGVLRHMPSRRGSAANLILLAPVFRKSSGLNPNAVAIAVDDHDGPPPQGRKNVHRYSGGGGEACDGNRMDSLLSYLPLREGFGEFCRRSLCSESFQFLLDVFEFKENLVLDASVNADGEKGFKCFGIYYAIVNDYIKDGAHSEVNIEFKTKRDILQYAKFKDYAALDLNGRENIFTAAEGEVKKMLVDNLLNKFLESAQYRSIVNFEDPAGRKKSGIVMQPRAHGSLEG